MSDSVANLNARFSLAGHVSFKEISGGLVLAEVRNVHGTADICLQGGHVTTWTPNDQSAPVVWLSDQAKFAPGKSIRGGAPVCWPWFGPHASESGFPGHGFARTVPWAVTETRALPGGETEVVLTLQETEQGKTQWPHASRLDIRVTVGASLGISLESTNLGAAPFVIGEALHTYFRIGDIGQIAVQGLDGSTYVDKVDGGARKTQSGAVAFSGEVDRVYLDTAAECIIEDAGLKRRIHVRKQNSQSTVLWTPWVEKAEKMGDFGPGTSNQGGWREMVCVESANALDNVVTVAPGATHKLVVEYAVSAL